MKLLNNNKSNHSVMKGSAFHPELNLAYTPFYLPNSLLWNEYLSHVYRKEDQKENLL